jgi:hypothetical protein
MKITFTNTSTFNLDHPTPASKFIPEWYKNTKSYMNDEKKPIGDGTTAATIKRCMPVLDAISSGYIIKLPVDIYVSLKDMGGGKKEQIFEWSALNFIGFHPIEQAPEHPLANSYPYPKFINPWSIQTPKGYSTLFIQPLHRESVFTILTGIVDTDTYIFPTNFPFVMNDPNFEGYIKEGTPIAQVIPIKRDKWITEIGDRKDLIDIDQCFKKLSTRFFDKYKNMFWNKKEYT